jgi:hypothetical protein
MPDYDTRPAASPDQELYQRLRTIEQKLDRLQGVIDRGDNWQPWIPIYALVPLNQTSFTNYAYTYGGFWGQDALIIYSPFSQLASVGHTWRVRTSDGLYSISDGASRTTTGTHVLQWLHPYQTHPEDYRYQPGSTSVLRLAPPDRVFLDFQAVAGGSSWSAWVPQSRCVSADVATSATTAGAFSYV